MTFAPDQITELALKDLKYFANGRYSCLCRSCGEKVISLFEKWDRREEHARTCAHLRTDVEKESREEHECMEALHSQEMTESDR